MNLWARQVSFLVFFSSLSTKIFVDPPSPPYHHTTTWKGPDRESWRHQPDQQYLIFAGRQLEDSQTLRQPSPDTIDNAEAKSRPAASYLCKQTAWGWSHLVWVFIQEYMFFSSVLFNCTNNYYQLNIVCVHPIPIPPPTRPWCVTTPPTYDPTMKNGASIICRLGFGKSLYIYSCLVDFTNYLL